MKKVCLIGNFGKGKNLTNGQTIKTTIVERELRKKYGDKNVICIDTYGGLKNIFQLPFKIFKALSNCKNIIIMPAENGLRIISPLLNIENSFFKRGIFYIVVGGWLPEFVSKRKYLKKYLKKMDRIYVETNGMKEKLLEQQIENISIIPNLKELKILKEKDLKFTYKEPIKVCTFSRVTKTKGIELAIEAIEKINKNYNKIIYSLDIFGQVSKDEKDWFDSLVNDFPTFIEYKGIISFEKTTEILKEYSFLLFPTYYKGEGFAGTIIDAMAAGVPIVASDWRYNSEIVKPEIGKLVENKNVDAIVNVLDDIYNNIEGLNELKKNCIKEAEKYTPSKALKPLIHDLLY